MKSLPYAHTHMSRPLVLSLSLAGMPAIVFAQETIRGILATIVNIMTAVIPAIMVLALLVFIWGAIKLVYFADDDNGRQEGKDVLVWGTLALFVMVSVWGLVQIIKVTFFGAL